MGEIDDSALPSAAADTIVRQPMVALLEAVDREGHVYQAWPIFRWPVSVGRALSNDVVLADPHVAAHHFQIDADTDTGDTFSLRVGDTLNGVVVDGRRVAQAGAVTLTLGRQAHEWVAGHTRLRMRWAQTPLAPERPLAAIVARHLGLGLTSVLALLLLGALAFNTYLDADPDNFLRVAGSLLLTALVGAALWCGAWSLLSKTITRQSHFSWHLRVFLMACLSLLVVGAVPAFLAFALSWPWLSDFSFIAAFAIGAVAFYFHLLAVEPARPKLMRAVVVAGAAVGIALTLWFNQQRTGRWGDELYMTHLFPPALRLARPVTVDRFIADLAPLHEQLDHRAQASTGAEGNGGSATQKRSGYGK